MLVGKPEGKRPHEKRKDGRIILKLILGNKARRLLVGLIWFRIATDISLSWTQ
jgi:hypothetical protein